jgi:hypothetical protein
MAETNEGKKIIIDDDWKAQAQAEKAKLDQEPAKAPAAGPVDDTGRQELPPADFAGLVNALVTNIIFALGGMEDPNSGKRFIDLDLAKHYIDLLAVLEAKTKNNLSVDEKKILDSALYETRLHYVQIAQRAAQM